MTAETVDAVVDFLAANAEIDSIDLTGGAPELNRNFRRLVRSACSRGLRLIDRCNLTILEEDGQEHLAALLAAHRVEVVASLPCYQEESVDRQRGAGAFERSLNWLMIFKPEWGAAWQRRFTYTPGLRRGQIAFQFAGSAILTAVGLAFIFVRGFHRPLLELIH